MGFPGLCSEGHLSRDVKNESKLSRQGMVKEKGEGEHRIKKHGKSALGRKDLSLSKALREGPFGWRTKRKGG